MDMRPYRGIAISENSKSNEFLKSTVKSTIVVVVRKEGRETTQF